MAHPNRMPTRRRVLAAIGAADVLGAIAHWPARERNALRHRWRGHALGAMAEITLYHPDRRVAVAALTHCRDEIERLENEFSLFRRDSRLSQLNRDGYLPRPSLNLRRTLDLALQFGALTADRFDVTVQPLWQLQAARPAMPPSPTRNRGGSGTGRLSPD